MPKRVKAGIKGNSGSQPKLLEWHETEINGVKVYVADNSKSLEKWRKPREEMKSRGR